MSDCVNVLKKTRPVDSDRVCRTVLAAVASLAAVTVVAMIIFIAGQGFDALSEVGIWEFLTGSVWRPYIGSYGAASLIAGTLMVTAGAMMVACPIGIGAAIYLSEIASPKTRKKVKPIIEVMAGIPSVVYGLLGIMILVPMMHGLFPDQTVSGLSWLTGSVLLGIMALPTVISVSDDALQTVPSSYREASLAIGATKWETIMKVIVPAAASGISAAVILGIGRAIGETMAVMMVTGNTAIFPDPIWNVFSTLRTITATLALEMPEVVVGSTSYSALFLLALILMIMILAINLSVRAVMNRSARKFSGDEKVGRLTLAIENMDQTKIRMFKDLLLTAAVAAAVFCGASLFTGTLQSMAAAVGTVVVWKVLATAGRRKVDRNQRQKLAYGSLSLVTFAIVAVLILVTVYIAVKAVPALSLDFLLDDPSRAGRSGGIFPAIVGTLELIAGTALIAVPLGVLTGVYLTEYGGNGRVTRVVTAAVDVLNGTPSVIFGLFGMVVIVVYLGMGYSLIAGCVTLALMTMPVIIRTTQEAVRAVPDDLREASRAIGATKMQTTFRVVLPTAVNGIVTGAILSLARAAGETAPIMFTAVVVQAKVADYALTEPVMALPYHLYYLATEGRADPSMMYATALVLLVIVLAMFLLASYVRARGEKRMRQ
ncbi:phosphate ABC transporter permease PstA [Methanomethylophilus alvi]|uniref:phosphate ABC transporter permease PstA n=1 Tax=Methanomethylophilus alvi TaxID=1291540 RepID=UPI0037DC8989